MALNLYRRHGSNCPGGRAFDERTYEADELRRNWKRCSCPIYASGTLSGRFKRKNTDLNTWPEAHAMAAGWELHPRWSGEKQRCKEQERRSEREQWFRNTSEWAMWPKLEVIRYLRARARGLSIHELQDWIRAGEHRLIFEDGSESRSY